MLATTLLINRQQLQQHKQFSNSNYNEKLEQIILETQFNQLRPLLGERFYNDILIKVSGESNKYDDLLNGGEYTYEGTTFINYGLRAVLSNYVYANWVMTGDAIDNPFGVTIKLNSPQSQPLSHQLKKHIYSQNNQTAYNYWLNVRRFMIRDGSYDLFSECKKNKTTFKLSKVRK